MGEFSLDKMKIVSMGNLAACTFPKWTKQVVILDFFSGQFTVPPLCSSSLTAKAYVHTPNFAIHGLRIIHVDAH